MEAINTAPVTPNAPGAIITSKSSFYKELQATSWNSVAEKLKHINNSNVIDALNNAGSGNPEHFLALISNVAKPYLQEMAALSEKITRQRFGNTINIFMPMYLANTCSNICTYCGFSYNNPIKRVVLSKQQILLEIMELKKKGIRQILVLTGEDHQKTHMPYFKEVIPLMREHFDEVNIEVQPLEINEYQEMRHMGVDGTYVYQETYHEKNYRLYHPKGKKSHFAHRLNTPERAGIAGMHKIGLGVLLGLENWQVDSYFCAMHLKYLKKHFWKSRFSVSFPRLRPAEGVTLTKEIHQKFPSQQQLAQLIFAYRIFDSDLLLSLSTRENTQFRDAIIPLGITSISVESKTNPGGYSCFNSSKESLEQFEISDTRSLKEMQQVLAHNELEPVMKDWMQELS